MVHSKEDNVSLARDSVDAILMRQVHAYSARWDGKNLAPRKDPASVKEMRHLKRFHASLLKALRANGKVLLIEGSPTGRASERAYVEKLFRDLGGFQLKKRYDGWVRNDEYALLFEKAQTHPDQR